MKENSDNAVMLFRRREDKGVKKEKLFQSLSA